MHGIDTEVHALQLAVKKLDQNSWMNGLGSGLDKGGFSSAVEQIEELEKDLTRRFS